MGSMLYGGTTTIPIDDRALAHLQAIVYIKLRARESFPFTWRTDARSGGGHGSVWICPGVPISFRYAGSDDPALNRDWLQALRHAANEPAGLRLLPEPDLR